MPRDIRINKQINFNKVKYETLSGFIALLNEEERVILSDLMHYILKNVSWRSDIFMVNDFIFRSKTKLYVSSNLNQ